MKITLINKISVCAVALAAIGALLSAPNAANASIPGTSGPSGTSSPDVFFFGLTGISPNYSVTEMNTGTSYGLPSSYITTTDGAAGGTYIFTYNPGATPNGSFDEVNAADQSLIEGTFNSLDASFISGTSVFVSGVVTYTGGSELLTGGYQVGDTGSLGVTLSNVATTGTSGATTEYGANSYGVSYSVTPAPVVPEPNALITISIAAAGLFALMAIARRRSAHTI